MQRCGEFIPVVMHSSSVVLILLSIRFISVGLIEAVKGRLPTLPIFFISSHWFLDIIVFTSPDWFLVQHFSLRDE
jgi:hypothetical protein